MCMENEPPPIGASPPYNTDMTSNAFTNATRHSQFVRLNEKKKEERKHKKTGG